MTQKTPLDGGVFLKDILIAILGNCVAKTTTVNKM